MSAAEAEGYHPSPGRRSEEPPGLPRRHPIWRDEPDPPDGRGIGRSGVTVIVPGAPETLVRQPLPAGTAVLNGAGELTSFNVIREWGVIQTPVYLTATMAVGRIYDGAVTAAVAADPSVGVDEFVIPVVAECDDGWLSEARVVQVEAADATRALEAASSGSVAEGPSVRAPA